MNKIYLLLASFFLLKVNIALADDLKIVSAEKFIAENPSPEREKIVNFIVHQFDKMQEIEISQHDLDRIWSNQDTKKKFMMYRFQIVDQKLYADSYDQTSPDFRSTLKYFDYLVRNYNVPDVDFIIYRKDRMPSNIETEAEKEAAAFPAILMSKNTKSVYEKDKILIPDNFLAHKGWKKIVETIIDANLKNYWESKSDIIFWRGATSNGAYDIKNFDKLPRLKLVLLSKLYPDLIDADFSRITHQFPDTDGAKNMKKMLKILNSNLSEVSEDQHLKYKYLISIDGNTCAWSRVPWIMLSNSVLLKQETQNMEWFYPAIVPYVHYVPVNEDLLNIFSQLEWMKNNDNKLKEISNNATKFVENNLMPEHIDAHMVIVLNEYNKLHRNKQIYATLPSFEERMSLFSMIRVLCRQIKDNLISWMNSVEYSFI